LFVMVDTGDIMYSVELSDEDASTPKNITATCPVVKSPAKMPRVSISFPPTSQSSPLFFESPAKL